MDLDAVALLDDELQLARFVGLHALPLFGIALALLMCAVVAAWWLWVRIERHGAPEPLPRERVLVLRLIAGFAGIVLAAMGFAEMAEALDASEELGRFDVELARVLRDELSAATLQAFAGLTHLGDTVTLTALCLVVALVLLWRGHRRLAIGWVVAVAANGALIRLLKAVFARVRPVHEHNHVVTESGFSFPSGHSAGAVLVYGLLAYVLLRFVPRAAQLPVLLLGASLAFTIGCSRVFLQVHYASDVLAGFASGGLWLAVCIMSMEWLQHRRLGRSALAT
ncbi:MAG: phosphatase PAP2 family protein [Rhizobacter sp.]|jgi:membrane-associated phospholipid phosphatase